MNVLITGSTGFVGAGVLRHLVRFPRFQVRAAARDPAATLPDGVERCVCECLGGGNLAGALAGMHAVVHLAARVHVMNETAVDPLGEFRRANVDGTLQLARQAAACGVRRFVFVSSIKVNGEKGRFTEEDAPAPDDPYGVSKLEAERGLRQLSSDTGMEVVIIRLPLVYGPNVKANFRRLVQAVRRGIPLPLGGVRNRRSLIALDNLVDFVVVCLTHPAAADETFLVSDGEDLSTPDLVRRLARAMGRPARLFPVPASVLLAAAAMLGRRHVARRLVDSLQLDIAKARQLLGWTPPISVDEGLRRVVASPD